MRPEPLVGRARQRVAAQRGDVDRRGAGWRARRRRRRAPRRPWAASTMPGRSGIVPTALEAAVTATQRVRGDSTASTAAAGSSRVSRSGSAKRTSTPGAGGGDEPRRDVRVVVQARADDLVARLQRPAAAAEKRMVSAVIEGPKTTPSAPAPSSRATEARASSTSASVRSAARNAPPWLAEWPERIQAAISSMASSTIWVPAAPSRRAQPSLRPGKRVRCMAADPSTVPRHATGRRRRDLAVLRAPRRRRAGAPHPGHERDAPGLGRARSSPAWATISTWWPTTIAGSGTPRRSPTPFTIAELADDAAGLLDDLGWDDRARRWGSRWAAWSPRSSRCAIRSGSARWCWAARTPAARRASWPTRP